MRIEYGEERKEIDIPISEIVKDGGELNILPSVKKYFSIDYKPKNDKLTLVAGGYIGFIPINDSLAIEIKPKFSISNLTRIVTIAEDKFKTLDFFSRKYLEKDDSSSVIFEFMAECLANELQALNSEGILKEYVVSSDKTHKIRGRISVSESIKSLWSHGHFNKAAIEYYDFTLNNPFNKLIKYTLNYCIRELDVISSDKIKLRNQLIEFYSTFDAVELDDSRDFLISVLDAIENDKVSVLRKYYINICEICRLIINKVGVSFDEVGSNLEMNSFILDMAKTFENYLLNSIRFHRSVFSESTVLLDGNKEGRKKFYNQPSFAKGDAKPDIIVKEGSEYKIIADAKYKTSSKDTDRYQVISHALSYGAKVAVLILPKGEDRTTKSLVKLGGVGDDFEIEVYEYFYNLSSDNLEQEEINLVTTLESLITTSH